MKLSKHILLGGAASITLYPVLGKNVAWFWASSVLIDVDHYIDYIYRTRFTDFSLSGMFEYHRILHAWIRRKDFLALSFFHTLEFVAVVGLLAVVTHSPALGAATAGLVFHLLGDLIYLWRKGVPFQRVHSFIEYLIRKQWLKRSGISTGRVYREALALMRERRAAVVVKKRPTGGINGRN